MYTIDYGEGGMVHEFKTFQAIWEGGWINVAMFGPLYKLFMDSILSLVRKCCNRDYDHE